MATNSPASSRRYQALVQLLRAADTVWNASRVFFERWGLSPSQFNVLNLLTGTAGGLSQTELSRELIMHRSNVTGLVDRLEQRGLVRRSDVAGDRRAYRVEVTETGKRLMDDLMPGYYEGVERVCQNLSEKKAAALITDLQEIARRAQRIRTELPPAAANIRREAAGRRGSRRTPRPSRAPA